MSDPEDPTRRFLDQTVPKHDEWDGREPEDGPARPRHVQHPEPVETFGAKQRRANTIRKLAWGVGPSAAFIAGAALSDNGDDVEVDADIDMAGGFGDVGSGL
ncbi:MAG: hypothetical protein WBA97_01955 [Actinophytocola sp.]|uniref:hypothetical protein n=1 Tax=Actinophytocola sp. TaxID=1872138 RepID=UPI003C772577